MSDVTIEELKDLLIQINKLKEIQSLKAISDDDWWMEKSSEVQMAMCQVLLECMGSRKYFNNFKAKLLDCLEEELE